ncbi:unnamed protein product, partial [Polarella glacialis]
TGAVRFIALAVAVSATSKLSLRGLERGFAAAASSRQRPLLVGVCGGSGSGKTTLCTKAGAELQKSGLRVELLSSDSYYKPLSAQELHWAEEGKFNFDEPAAVDLPLMAEHLSRFRDGQEVEIPEYSHALNARVPSVRSIVASRCDVLFVDGLYVLRHDLVRSQLDLKIFIDVNTDACLARRISRDKRERCRTEESVAAQWESTVLPGFEAFIRPSRLRADIIV